MGALKCSIEDLNDWQAVYAVDISSMSLPIDGLDWVGHTYDWVRSNMDINSKSSSR